MIITQEAEYRIPKIDVVTAINTAKGKQYNTDPEHVRAMQNLGYDAGTGFFTIKIPTGEDQNGIYRDIVQITKDEIASFVSAYTGHVVEANTISSVVDDGTFYRLIL